LFSQKEFIDASRKFVCVRLESYESKEHQDMVREFLGGRFANTAFGILAPDGETRLSGTGRGPERTLVGRGFRGKSDISEAEVIDKLESIASSYRPAGKPEQAVLQDFHSFRQALNVASADQRLLVYAVASEKEEARIRAALAPVFAHDEIVGRFHLDFSDESIDAKWKESVRGSSDRDGLYVIRADRFGQTGQILERLALSTDPDSIRGALLAANLAFSVVEEKKHYASHVASGRREGIYFENGMPYGEDRDGDGEIDHRGGGKGSPKGGGKGKGKGRL
jgi:hypothetical protein